MNDARLDYLSDPGMLAADLTAVRKLLVVDQQADALVLLETMTPRRYRHPRHGNAWYVEVETPNAGSVGRAADPIADAYAEILSGQQMTVRGVEMFLPGVDVFTHAAVPHQS